jgi:hypothetical protein
MPILCEETCKSYTDARLFKFKELFTRSVGRYPSINNCPFSVALLVPIQLQPVKLPMLKFSFLRKSKNRRELFYCKLNFSRHIPLSCWWVCCLTLCRCRVHFRRSSFEFSFPFWRVVRFRFEYLRRSWKEEKFNEIWKF